MRPLLGKTWHRVQIALHSLANVDLVSHKGKLLVPAFTQRANYQPIVVRVENACSTRHLRSLGVRRVRYVG